MGCVSKLGHLSRFLSHYLLNEVQSLFSLNTFWSSHRYNEITGKFVPDTAGLYFFQQHWVADADGNQQYLSIRKNDTVQCWSYGDGFNSGGGDGDYNVASCSATMELSPGDEVYVSSMQGLPFKIEYTYFTGFLIKSYD